LSKKAFATILQRHYTWPPEVAGKLVLSDLGRQKKSGDGLCYPIWEDKRKVEMAHKKNVSMTRREGKGGVEKFENPPTSVTTFH
jgi:hypothetical protein